jgi:esterase/lipase superfamily enzyme
VNPRIRFDVVRGGLAALLTTGLLLAACGRDERAQSSSAAARRVGAAPRPAAEYHSEVPVGGTARRGSRRKFGALLAPGRHLERSPHAAEGTSTPNYAQVEVFYGTDRAPSGSGEPEEFFGPGRSRPAKLSLGVCRVSVPLDHRMGEVERPSIWKLEFRPDPAKHMVLMDLSPLPRGSFLSLLSSAVGRSPRKEVLVFVHGFNVSFSEAVLRTAQMSYDLGFRGVPVTYSWPSRQELSPLQYHADEATIDWTVPHLESFLADLAARSGARSVHLIAHSMGNRALTAALERLAAKQAPKAAPLFSQIVLTAPDMDADTFVELAREFPRAAERVTLYASSNDRALQFSRSVHGGFPRAGDSGPEVVVVPGVDTVEVSGVDTSLMGHSYYGENRSVLTDLFSLLRDRKAPAQRFGLSPRKKKGLPYWVFQP